MVCVGKRVASGHSTVSSNGEDMDCLTETFELAIGDDSVNITVLDVGNIGKGKMNTYDDDNYLERDINHIRWKCIPNKTSPTKKKLTKAERKKKRKQSRR